MGLFGWLKDKVEDAVDWVRDRIDDVKDFFSNKRKSDVKNYQEETKKDIQEMQREVEKEKIFTDYDKFNRNTANVREIESMSARLNKAKKYSKRFGSRNEKRAFDLVSYAVDEIINSIISNLNDCEMGGKKLNLNISSLKNEADKIRRDKKEFITNYINKKISLDNDECLDVLEMEDAYERNEEMNQLRQDWAINALEEFSFDVKSDIEIQTNSIFEKIESRLSNMEDMTQKKTQDVDNIYKLKQQDDDKFELKIINLAFDTGVCDLALELVGNTPDTVKVNVQKIPELKDVVSRFERTVRKADNDNGLAVNYKVKIKSGSKNYFGGSIPATAFSQVWTVTRINGSKIYLKNNDGSSLIIKEEYIERGI